MDIVEFYMIAAAFQIFYMHINLSFVIGLEYNRCPSEGLDTRFSYSQHEMITCIWSIWITYMDQVPLV